MNNHYTFTIFMALIAIMVGGTTMELNAQTRRVRCGENPSGMCQYREVYEYDYVGQKPSFPGGDTKLVDFINSERRYPEEAYHNGVQGRVVCSFVVNEDGSISNIEVIKGVCASLNAEAVRILANMPDWTPGKIDGHNVPVRVIHPVAFRR